MKNVSRRQFIKKSAAGLIGAAIPLSGGRGRAAGQEKALASGQEKAGSSVPPKALKIKEYRILGRTGFKVSDIGAGSIQNDGVLRAALDAGVNYLDTAEEYPGHHRIIAKAIQGLDRKGLFIATKLEVKEDKSKEGFLKRARKCLEELQMDYVDCLMMHCPERAETLKTEGFHAAMGELKAEGRVRFVGASHHGSFWFRDSEETMEKILLAAAEDGRFDVFLMAYNFLQMDQAEHVLEVCRERNIGTAIMKSAPVAIYYNMKSRIEQLEKDKKEIDPLYADGLKRYKDKAKRAEAFIKKYNLGSQEEITEAAVRFVLENPNVGTVCCLARTYTEMNQFLGLSGTRLSGWKKGK